LIPAWQLKVNPVRVRLRELLSILLAAEILQCKMASPRPAHVRQEAPSLRR